MAQCGVLSNDKIPRRLASDHLQPMVKCEQACAGETGRANVAPSHRRAGPTVIYMVGLTCICPASLCLSDHAIPVGRTEQDGQVGLTQHARGDIAGDKPLEHPLTSQAEHDERTLARLGGVEDRLGDIF